MNVPKKRRETLLSFAAIWVLMLAVGFDARPENRGLLNPEELVKILQSSKGDKPLLIQVGFRVLYQQAYIPGSEYIGPASSESGLEQFRKRMSSLPRSKFIVIYCGCCPWDRCPNVKPAADALRALGFTNVKVLYISDNFGANWVDKGYPVAK